VARAAGVGRQTVSNVLNDSGRVGEATKVRVLEAVAALGYHPHHGARSLRSRRTRQLAYVMPRVQLLPGNYIMQQFLQALAAASARRSHSVVVVVPDGDPREEMRRLIASRTVDAFLLSELQPEDPRVVLLAEAGIPFACFGRIGSGLPQHWVDIGVRDSIDRPGYRPSHAAAALVRGTPRTVAVLVAHMTRPSTVVRVASALAVLAEEGYDTIICNVDTPAERDRHLETLLPTHRADGVLAISLPLSREQLGQFGQAGVTLVSVDAVTPGTAQTVIDDVAGGRMATGHLIGLGHRRIGFVGDMTFAKPPAGLGFTSSANRLRGYRQALAGPGLPRLRGRPGPARPARRGHRRRARRPAAQGARSPDRDLRDLRHPGVADMWPRAAYYRGDLGQEYARPRYDGDASTERPGVPGRDRVPDRPGRLVCHRPARPRMSC
jgi:DNA-binding LacI/PurR family transcriptional regulator